jgi:ATP/maltotriose-dependent transcriptional regulator MalT
MGTSALFHTAYVLWFLGKPDESLDVMAEARAHAATLPFDFPLCHALVASALLHAQRDEIDLATEHADRAIAMAASNEWTVMARQAAFAKGRAAWLRGDPESATTIIEPAVGELLQPGGFGGSTLALTWLAEAELDAGRNDRARSTIARTEAIVRRTDERLFVPELMRVKSRALIAIGRSEDAAAEADGALALARAHGNAAFEAKARVTRGRGAS